MIIRYRIIQYRIFAYRIIRFRAARALDFQGRAALWVSPENYKVAGVQLAAVRRRAGVSQDQLAALIGKPQSFISAYERGERRIDLLEFMVIMAALKADAKLVFADLAERLSKPST